MPFLINEDQALKQWLKGMTVADNQATRSVGVWFKLPEKEEREVSWPYITIEFLDVNEEPERAHRGRTVLNYAPEGWDPSPDGFTDKTEWPIPVALLYQIVTHTRSAMHDRQLQATILSQKLPFRFGALLVPADETVRELQLIDVRSADYLDQNRKRVFRKVYTISVSAELLPESIVAIQRVETVHINVDYQLEPFTIDA